MKGFRFALLIVFAMFMACSDDMKKDRRLDFVGDSIIARWDLAEYFPSRNVHNYGLSGAGIDYIESLAGQFDGAEVVIMIGTNNNDNFVGAKIDDYIALYMDAILNLGAAHVYLYSVLPRDFANDREAVNADIEAFNARIQSIVAEMPGITYMNVYADFLKGGKINPQLYNDRLHLSPYGYEILTQALLKQL